MTTVFLRDLQALCLRWLPALLAALLATVAGLPTALAAPTAKPVLELVVNKVLAAQGDQAERLVSADTAQAGDTLQYRAVYTNATASTVRNAQITLPVPANGVQYLIDSSAPGAQRASSDGKRFDAVPLMRSHTGPDGKPVQKPAPAADYRFLRWELGDLAPGASRSVSARVQLLPVGSSPR